MSSHVMLDPCGFLAMPENPPPGPARDGRSGNDERQGWLPALRQDPGLPSEGAVAKPGEGEKFPAAKDGSGEKWLTINVVNE